MRQKRIVLVPCPYQGHINPMLQLGTILQSNGFFITIIHTQYNSPNPSNHPNLTFLSIPDGLSDGELSSGDYTAHVLALNVNCVAPLEKCLIQTMKDEQVCCIIYDELMYFSESVATRLRIPSIVFRTNNAATFLARGYLLQLSLDGLFPLPDSSLEELVEGHNPLRFKDLPTNSIFGTSEDFLQALSNLRNIRTSSAEIWNTTNCLEKSSLAKLKQECHVPIFPIGPIYKISQSPSHSLLNEDTNCITWLNTQKPNSVIYISLGSLASMNATEFAEMAWGLANSKQPFLWVIKPGSILDSNWIESLPQGFNEAIEGRGFIVKWAPQMKVLKHNAIRVFWTHCGWNSTMESVCEGVPMICRPNFGDQKVTARFVSDVWRIGLHLENELKREEIERIIKRLMADNEGEGMRQRALDLKKKIEASIEEGGCSYNSLKELVDFIMSIEFHG